MPKLGSGIEKPKEICFPVIRKSDNWLNIPEYGMWSGRPKYSGWITDCVFYVVRISARDMELRP